MPPVWAGTRWTSARTPAGQERGAPDLAATPERCAAAAAAAAGLVPAQCVNKGLRALQSQADTYHCLANRWWANASGGAEAWT